MTVLMTRKARRRAEAYAAFFLLAAALLVRALLPAPAVRSVLSARADDLPGFLAGYGWQVDPRPVAREEVTLPAAFPPGDAFYALQESQGFDLAPYRGRTVTRQVYRVLNYPTGEQDIFAVLLVCGGAVIAGSIQSPRLDGFLHGLTLPA